MTQFLHKIKITCQRRKHRKHMVIEFRSLELFLTRALDYSLSLKNEKKIQDNDDIARIMLITIELDNQ